MALFLKMLPSESQVIQILQLLPKTKKEFLRFYQLELHILGSTFLTILLFLSRSESDLWVKKLEANQTFLEDGFSQTG